MQGFRTSVIIRAAAALIFSGGVASCSLAPFIGSDISKYQVAGGAAADRQILGTVLLAKDRQPIHFEQLTQLHGAVTGEATLGLIAPIGPIDPSTVGRTLTAGGGFSQSPSFDIGTLDDQNFWRGIVTQPIAPETITALMRTGLLSPSITFLLIFYDIDVPADVTVRFPAAYPDNSDLRISGPKYIMNSPEPADSDVILSAGRAARDGQDRRWWGFLSYVSHTVGARGAFFYVHPYKELRAVVSVRTSGESPFVKEFPSVVKELAESDPKWVIEPYAASDSSGRPKPAGSGLSSVAQKYALCLHTQGREEILLGFPDNSQPAGLYEESPNQVCAADSVHVRPDFRSGTPLPYLTFRVRSVYGVLQYLGDVLRWQQEHPGQCISVRPPSIKSPDCGGNILFRVNAPGRTPTLAVEHDGQTFYLSGSTVRECELQSFGQQISAECDHSLQVLAALEVLINLNKSVGGTVQTPTVRTVP